MSDAQQNQNATITYIHDWTTRLAKAYPASSITIASATGTTSAGTLTSVSGSGTSITFKLATSAVTPPTDVTVTLTPTLSNGDVDPVKVVIGVTS